ncbi:hypothetical protein LBMAG48_03340 [Phycisphaerae bacterium]|jgi:hypothetical protein|nr:hypothetical protein LBMAG48_03340 [Phycisphaerae bacterium]
MNLAFPILCAGLATSLATTALAQTPAAFTSLLDRSSRITSLALTLDTPAGDTGKPERILLTLDNQKRIAFARYRSEDGKLYPNRPFSFLYFDGSTSRTSRVGRDSYIENTETDLWNTVPPRWAMLAPWPMLNQLTQHASADDKHTFTTGRMSCDNITLASPKFAFNLNATRAGELAGLTIDINESTWNLTFADASPVQVGDVTIALPSRIIECETTTTEAADKTTSTTDKVTTWTVTALDVNPADLDQRLHFDPAALEVKKWDVESGKILDATGKQVGLEEIPAARSVETWEITTKASSWIAVWKWGSIVAGLGLFAFIMDMIRRRL